MQIDDNADSWLTCMACCILIRFKQYGMMQALKSTTNLNDMLQYKFQMGITIAQLKIPQKDHILEYL